MRKKQNIPNPDLHDQKFTCKIYSFVKAKCELLFLTAYNWWPIVQSEKTHKTY